LKLYQVLSNFLLACCFVAVLLLFSAENQQANSNKAATWREGCSHPVFEKRCYYPIFTLSTGLPAPELNGFERTINVAV